MIIKILKNVISIIKYIIVAIIVFIVAIILVQRFSNNNMSVAGYRIFAVVTESMVPKYNVGDVLLVKKTDPEKIEKEDDVTYIGEKGSFANKIVTHQVIDIEKADDGTLNFTTKGIANDKEDPIVNESQVYGVVQRKLNLVTKLNGIINNTYGMYFLIIIPFAVIVFSEIKAFKEDAKIKKEEDNEEDGSEEKMEENIDRRTKKRKERRVKRRRKYE